MICDILRRAPPGSAELRRAPPGIRRAPPDSAGLRRIFIAEPSQPDIYCWPDRANQIFIAGPTARYLLLASQIFIAVPGQPDIYCWPDRASQIFIACPIGLNEKGP